MGLFFYPRETGVPSDHCIHTHLRDFPDRFAKQKLLKDWTVEGPFADEDADEHYFFLKGANGLCEQHSISSSDFLFNKAAVENWISRVICRCMEIELHTGVAARLLGKSEEEVNSLESSETYIVEDYSRGTGKVSVRSHSRETIDSANPEKRGLILP